MKIDHPPISGASVSAIDLVYMPVEATAYADFLKTLQETGSTEPPATAASNALRRDAERRRSKFAKAGDEEGDELAKSRESTFAWRFKNVRIPFGEGDKFRMYYKGQAHDGEVVNGKIRYAGEDYDEPGGMITAITGSSRSGWTNIWVMRKQDKDWILADELRKDPAHIEDENPSHPPVLFADAVKAISKLRQFGFPEEAEGNDPKNHLFFPLHHMNMDPSKPYNETLRRFDAYAKTRNKAAHDSNNGRIIRRLCWLAEQAEQHQPQSRSDWKKLVKQAVESIPMTGAD